MVQGNRRIFLFGTAIILVIAACTVSGNGGGDGIIPATHTPNLTLTEWFRPTSGSQDDAPTATSQPDSEDPTQAADAPAPTNTPTPSGQTGGDDTQPDTTAPDTPTLIPTQTLTPISFQGAGSDLALVIEYLDDAPTIDGDTGDWGGEIYALDKIVKGTEFYANALDLSGDFKIGWDMEYLYIGVTVRDTQFVQTASGPQLGMGDSLEVLLDTQWEADLSDDELSADDFQLGFSAGNLREVSIPEGYMWAPIDRAAPLTMAQVTGRLIDDGYMMEIAIAWEELGVTPEKDMAMGFLLSVSDNDSINRVEQQSVLSFASERSLSNPTTWVPVVLVIP
ncbi:MAG TPA: sugar-binding protein [Anaerolineales bacterium]|nr:sugar-binding protein [Anaerolineales bacterium]